MKTILNIFMVYMPRSQQNNISKCWRKKKYFAIALDEINLFKSIWNCSIYWYVRLPSLLLNKTNALTWD